ncbi:ABC transporter permease subunit [Lacrimispora saccharolytica]|nr:ABC transporter permease subunit [Lacrimispora saccharolytica]
MEEMMKQMQGKRKRTKKENVRMALIVLFWLVLWEIADRVIDNRIILVGPTHILMALAEQVGQSDFWVTCGASFLRIAVGFVLSFIGGFVLALVCYRYKLIRDFLEPIMIMLKTVPMISFVIMLLIWVGNQALTIYLSFLIVLPIIYTNTLQGLQSVDVQLLEMAQVFHMAPWKKFMFIYRPAFMPFVLSASKLALGMSWKSGIMAEVIGTPKPSIGREMYAAKTYLQTSNLFAWTIVVVILSVLFETLFMAILKKLSAPMGWLAAGRDDSDDDWDEDDGEWSEDGEGRED